ncbi:hypothetical protein CQ047_17825 [Microbacterium sp. MYb72]|uniref:phage tail tube protein n=1 Tax=Microbacterium sp. MYb72 TaxID=1848693 RepID=UPI000CFBCBD0|nr:hypothetical protein [Microbacterium sp. MYb72]PRB02763.1 hypothetical protein CQ047_17825 [Microbacterium sp. MYb72]
MTTETVQEGFGYDGKGIVLFVPTLANPAAPTIAELNAGTVKKLTYGLYGPQGYALATTRNERVSTRYTLDQELTADGTVKYKLTLLYVYNRETPTVAETVLGVVGTSGYIVHALGYDNGHTFEAGDKINDIVPITTSASDDIPATANTDAHKTTSPTIRGKVEREVVVAAA